MSQLQKPITSAPSIRLRPERFFAAVIIGAAVASAFVAGTLVGAGLQSSDTVAAPRAVSGEVTDGWMHGTSAFGTLARSGQVTDGWAARYLPSSSAADVTDGWAARYLPSSSAADVTDGWAARYLPSAQGD